MSDVLAKIKGRRCFPVEVAGGTVHVRSLSRGELSRMDKLDQDARTPFILGCVICESDGSQALPKRDGESDEQYAERVNTATEDVDSETVAIINSALARIGKTPPVEALAKN